MQAFYIRGKNICIIEPTSYYVGEKDINYQLNQRILKKLGFKLFLKIESNWHNHNVSKPFRRLFIKDLKQKISKEWRNKNYKQIYDELGR